MTNDEDFSQPDFNGQAEDFSQPDFEGQAEDFSQPDFNGQAEELEQRGNFDVSPGFVDYKQIGDNAVAAAKARDKAMRDAGLISKEDAKAKGEIGTTEAAQKDYEAATGAEAPKNPILAQIANMGLTVGGRLNANLQMKAAQNLAAGGNYDDKDVDDLMNQMIYGGVHNVGKGMTKNPSIAGPAMILEAFKKTPQHAENEIMRKWDEGEGKKYSDPEERRIARMRYAQQIATDFIKDRTATKQNAETELNNREVTHTAQIVSRGLGMIGYSAPYMLGPVGIGLQFLEEGTANAVGYSNDEYGYDQDGKFSLVSEGDDPVRAAVAGFGTQAGETATEIVGGKIGGAILKGGAKRIGKKIVGNKVADAIGAVAGKTAETLGKNKAGRATIAFAHGLGSIFKWTGRKMHFDGLFEENLEEAETMGLGALTGWGMRKSELMNQRGKDGMLLDVYDYDANGNRKWSPLKQLAHDAGEFFSKDELIKLNEAMLLTMGGGAAVAYFANRGSQKEVDNILRKYDLMSEEKLKTTSLEDKVAAFKAFADGLDDEQTAKMIDDGAGLTDRLAEHLEGVYDENRTRINELRREMEKRHAENNGAELAELNVPYQKFNLPTKADGAVDFQPKRVTNDETGEEIVRERCVVDEASGMCIVDNDGDKDAPFSLFGPNGEKLGDFDTVKDAQMHGENVLNYMALSKAIDDIKQKWIANEVEQNYGGSKLPIYDFKTADEAAKAGVALGGVDVSQDANYNTGRKAWRVKDKDGNVLAVMLVRDNIKNPNEAREVIRHEVVGHNDKTMTDEFVNGALGGKGEEVGRVKRNYDFARNERNADANRALREAVANTIDDRRHSADTIDKLVHGVRNFLRDRGINIKMNDADFEVEVAKIEKELRKGKGVEHESFGGVETGTNQRFEDVAPKAASEAPKAPEATPAPGTEAAPETATDFRKQYGEYPLSLASKEEHDLVREKATDEEIKNLVEMHDKAETEEDFNKFYAEQEKVLKRIKDEAEAAGKAAGGGLGEEVKQNLYRKFKVGYADVDKIVNNKRVFQFKEDADPESGVVSGQRLEGPYREEAENPILIYVWNDGTMEMGSGRHRLDLAKKNGVKKILARFVYEKDGYTPEDVMVMDATSNIIDEKGSVKDYVNYFNKVKPTRDEAAREGLLDREKGRNAFSIFEGATDDTKQLIDWSESGREGLISPKDAAIIVNAAPKNDHKSFSGVQKVLVNKCVNGNLHGRKLAIVARSLAEEAKNRKGAVATSGEMQLDLFTSAEDLAMLAREEERANYRVGKAEEYKGIANTITTAIHKGGKLDLNAEYAKELGITDPKDKEQLKKARDKAVERANYWENAIALDEADKTAMDAHLDEAAAKSKSKLAAVKEARAAVKAGKPLPKKLPGDGFIKGKTIDAYVKKLTEIANLVNQELDNGTVRFPDSADYVVQAGKAITKIFMESEDGSELHSKAEKALTLQGSLEVAYNQKNKGVDAVRNVLKGGRIDVSKTEKPAPKKAESPAAKPEAKIEVKAEPKAKAATTDSVATQTGRITKDGSVRIVSSDGKTYEVELPDIKLTGEYHKATSKEDLLAQHKSLDEETENLRRNAPSVPINHRTGKHYQPGSKEYDDWQRRSMAFDEAIKRASNEALEKIGDPEKFDEEGSASATTEKKSAVAEKPKVAPQPERKRTVKMKNEAEEKRVKSLLDAIEFSSPELDTKNLAKFTDWTAKYKLNPTDEKRQKEFAAKNGIDFTSDEFDYEKFGKLVTGVGKFVDALVENGHNSFESMARYISEVDAEKFARAEPVLQDVWNAVAKQKKLSRVSDDEAERIYASIRNEPENAKSSSDGITTAVASVRNLIKGGKFTRQQLTAAVEQALGKSVAKGELEMKQVTDILELAVNEYIRDEKIGGNKPDGMTPAEYALQEIGKLRAILEVIPTQTTRSEEQERMQQFSTPPHEAYIAAWIANIGKGDVMMEPSAGVGGIAVFAKNMGAKVITNELSARRRELLDRLGISEHSLGLNAEVIYPILEPKIKASEMLRPTVVVMNPPFSNAQLSNKKDTHIGADHVEQALKLLAPGGRLVAIVGNGMAQGKPAFKAWWDRIGKEYTVRANITINGNEYAKYGTSFDNNILVIDKVTPTGAVAPIYGKIESIDELPSLLEGVRNDRAIAKSDNESQHVTGRTKGNQNPQGNGGASLRGQAGGARSAGSKGGKGGSVGFHGLSNGRGVHGERDDGGSGGSDSGNGTSVGGVSGGGQSGASSGDGADGGNRTTVLSGDGSVETDGELKTQNVENVREVGDGTFSEYQPTKLRVPGAKKHPTALVEPSAMASVPPPDVKYAPKIPQLIIDKGVLSEAQIEQVVYAGQAHQQMLGDKKRRKGYFIADGTGVGKGREISGIILDNWNHGRRKAVWISKSSGLVNDAKRDLTPFGLDQKIFSLESNKLKTLKGREGVAFTTYSSLAKNHGGIDNSTGVVRTTKGDLSRIKAIADWFGRDYDGVIVFDEAHKAGNAIPEKGKFGWTKPSQEALAMIDLQHLLPNARIVYVSATGATKVSNLAYAERLGLWGEGTAFKDRDAFISKVSDGGLSVMEVVARDMKAMGVYMARSLSYEGIENRRVEHKLSPDQKKLYNIYANAWREVLENIDNVMMSSGAIHNGKARSNAMKQFWSNHQRFFNQVLTSMMMPSVLANARKMWEDGYSPVFQIVNTNESAQKRAIEREGEDADIENLDLSPREILVGYIETSFPVDLFKEVDSGNDDGKTRWERVPDGNGGWLKDPAAVEARDALISKMRRLDISDSPLDMILSEFGHENVAEVTGRTARREWVDDENGGREMRIVKRSPKLRSVEVSEFNDGKRTVLVFSGAANTGFSFHADRSFKNQRRRAHYLIQPGANAADALQGLGRTHRSNESSQPIYFLCSTDLPGHKRFMSSVARRLAQLGSLTAGDRSSAGSGVFSEEDNLENKYALNAVEDLFADLFYHDRNEFDRVAASMGYMTARVRDGEMQKENSLIDKDGNLDLTKVDIPHFLNRILAMEIDDQNALFDNFAKKMHDGIEEAKENGTFDPGLQKLQGKNVEVKNRVKLWDDPNGTGSTDLVEVSTSHKSRKKTFAEAKDKMEYSAKKGETPKVYVHNASNNLVMIAPTNMTKTLANGQIVRSMKKMLPTGETGYISSSTMDNYTPLSDADGAKQWDEEYAKLPELEQRQHFFVNGTLLPIWDKLGANNPKMYRITPEVGSETKAFLGLEIAPEKVDALLGRFGKHIGSVALTPDVVLNRVLRDGKKVALQNGWQVARSKVLGENRIEVKGIEEDSDVKDLGESDYVFTEKIAGVLRAFLRPNAESMAAFLEKYPAVPERGDIASVTGSLADMSGDKYKAPLEKLRKEIAQDMVARRFAGEKVDYGEYEDGARKFMAQLSDEQLNNIFYDYKSKDTGVTSDVHILRRAALRELMDRNALTWKIKDDATAEAVVNSGSREAYYVDFMSDDLAPRVTPEEDAAYADAVKRGDREAALRMVRAAAAKAMPNTKVVGEDGLPKVVYHATDGDFTVFDRARIGSSTDAGMLGKGFYFAGDERGARGYGINMRTFFLNARHPYEMDKDEFLSMGRREGIQDKESVLAALKEDSAKLTEKLRAGGYDCALYVHKFRNDHWPQSTEYCVFNPSQIKSADITYDDAGNLIPLSKRFNPNNPRIDFDSPDLDPAAKAYAESEDKTPTEDVSRKVFGMTNDDIATELRAAGLEPPKHVRKPDETLYQQVEILMSNPGYMPKLANAVAQFSRPTSDYETMALGVYFHQCKDMVNEQQKKVDALQDIADNLAADTEIDHNDEDYKAQLKEARDDVKEAKVELKRREGEMKTVATANMKGVGDAARTLRSHRFTLSYNGHDYSIAGIKSSIAAVSGGAIPEGMEPRIKELAKTFESLDEDAKDFFSKLLRAETEKYVAKTKKDLAIRKGIEKKSGDEAKHVLKIYNDAIAQIIVNAEECGGSLIGLADQMYPKWGRWLKAIGEYYCFVNPEITEPEVMQAIAEEVSRYGIAADADSVREMIHGGGHNYRQSRFQSQRHMNELKKQSRLKWQRDYMLENGKLAPVTGMIRDEDQLQETRNLEREVREAKQDIDDINGGADTLKGRIQSTITRLTNEINDINWEIENLQRIPRRERKVIDDARVTALTKERDTLRALRDRLLPKEPMSDAEKIKIAEKALERVVERTFIDLANARAGDTSMFTKNPLNKSEFVKRLADGTATMEDYRKFVEEKGESNKAKSAKIQLLRNKLSAAQKGLNEVKQRRFIDGLTPLERANRIVRKMKAREDAIIRMAERIENGDLRPNVKPQLPMSPEMQKRYEEMGKQLKKAHQKLADMRLEAQLATVPKRWTNTKAFAAFAIAAQRALKTTIDFSAMLNQAARVTLSHPFMAVRSFGKAWTAMRSEASLTDVNDEIMSDPMIQEAVEKYGLRIREVSAERERDVDMFKGIESQKINLFGHKVAITDIPYYGELMLKSERHYITYLNAISADLYSHIAGGIPDMTPWEKKQLCDLINIWNGSGAMSEERRQSLNKSGVSQFVFSLPLAISQIQTTGLYDIWRPLTQPGLANENGGYDPVSDEERKTIAKIGAREHFKGLMALLLLGTLIRWISSDDDDKYAFSKADPVEKFLLLASPKIGNTTLDFTGGNLSLLRRIYKIGKGTITGKYTTNTGRNVEWGKFGADTGTMLWRYLQGKAAPWISSIMAMLDKKNFVGDKYGMKEAVEDLFVPMSMADIYEQYSQNGVGRTLFTALLTILGARAQTYDRKPYENAVNPFMEAFKEYREIESGDGLDAETREKMLENIRSGNPLMRDGVRNEIAAEIGSIRRRENKAKESGDKVLQKEVEQAKAKLLEKIRAARR